MNNPKLIVAYYGKFQPPHLGHYSVYRELVNVFGKNSVYVATSNKTDKKNPLSFQWKAKLLKLLGIPSSRIIQTDRPYNVRVVLDAVGVDPTNAVFIVALGEKDSKRLTSGTYYEKYKKGMKLESMDQRGYYYVVKDESRVKVNGQVLSSTMVRDVLRKDNLGKNDYEFFKQALGATRAAVDNLKPLFEHYGQDMPLLQEGGMGGHLSNLYDDVNLKFSDLEKIITDSLSGELNKEEIREKTDGQNLFASFIDGQVRLSRNKAQTKNYGENALDINAIADQWGEKSPGVADAFTGAFKALEKAFKQLPKDDLDEIFDNGANWVNMEIIWPSNPNVFHYGEPQIVFHAVEMVSGTGDKVGVDSSLTSKLFASIEKIEQGETKIKTPPFVKLKPHVDFSAKAQYFLSKLGKFRSQQRVGNDATLGDWYEGHFFNRLTAIETKMNKKIEPDLKQRLAHRFAYRDNSLKLTDVRKELADVFMYGEISKLAKDVDKEHVMAREPLALLLMELGVEVLSNLEQYLSASPEDTIESLRKDIASKIAQIRGSKNVDDIEKMRGILKRIDSVGGMKKIVPTEGIIFTYNGKSYKITGTFSPVTSLLGMGRYG